MTAVNELLERLKRERRWAIALLLAAAAAIAAVQFFLARDSSVPENRTAPSEIVG